MGGFIKESMGQVKHELIGDNGLRFCFAFTEAPVFEDDASLFLEGSGRMTREEHLWAVGELNEVVAKHHWRMMAVAAAGLVYFLVVIMPLFLGVSIYGTEREKGDPTPWIWLPFGLHFTGMLVMFILIQLLHRATRRLFASKCEALNEHYEDRGLVFTVDFHQRWFARRRCCSMEMRRRLPYHGVITIDVHGELTPGSAAVQFNDQHTAIAAPYP